MTTTDPLRQGLAAFLDDGLDPTVRPTLSKLFAAEDFGPHPDATYRDHCAAVYRRMRTLHEGLGVPGPLLHHPDTLHPLLEWAAIADPSLFHALFLHHGMVTGTVLDLGQGREDIADHLRSLTDLTAVGAALMTEIGHGNSNSAPRTQAHYDAERGDFVLRTPEPAAVKYPPNVGLDGVPRLAVVAAELVVSGQGRGAFFFIVPLRDENGPATGVRITAQPPTPLLPIDYAAVSFDDVRVPFRNWLRESATLTPGGAFTDPLGSTGARRSRTLSIIRFAWQAATVGLAAVTRASAALATHHAHRRITNGRDGNPVPVFRYRAQQRLLLSALASAYAANTLATVVKRLPVREFTPAGFGTALLAKMATQALAERTTTQARKASGALGYFGVNRFVEYHALANSFNSAAGDTHMLVAEVARILAGDAGYQPPAGDPPAPGGRSLLDRATWLGLLRAAEREQHRRVREAVREGTGAGRDDLTLWNELHDPAQRLADAYATRTTAELLAAAGEKVTEPRARAVLEDLFALFALEHLAQHAAWYLCAGLLTSDEATAVPDLIGELCTRLAPHALTLAQALDVPQEATRAPIGTDDYVRALTEEPAAPRA